jgi:hypothetical protein
MGDGWDGDGDRGGCRVRVFDLAVLFGFVGDALLGDVIDGGKDEARCVSPRVETQE